MTASIVPLWLTLSLFLYGEVGEQRISLFHDGQKSTVVIELGMEQIVPYRFYEASGIYHLEIPGSYPEGFFTKIKALPFVSHFECGPAGPAKTQLTMALSGALHFEVFDGEPGNLILFFEGENVSRTAATSDSKPQDDQRLETPVEVANPSTVQAAASHGELSISGVAGPQRLSGVHFSQSGPNEIVTLDLAGKFEHRSFFLEEPRRFVLDLKGIVFSLNSHRLIPASETISQVRVRQFQADPVPISRLVLDMRTDAPVHLQEVENHLILVLGEQVQPTIALDDGASTLGTLPEQSARLANSSEQVSFANTEAPIVQNTALDQVAVEIPMAEPSADVFLTSDPLEQTESTFEALLNSSDEDVAQVLQSSEQASLPSVDPEPEQPQLSAADNPEVAGIDAEGYQNVTDQKDNVTFDEVAVLSEKPQDKSQPEAQFQSDLDKMAAFAGQEEQAIAQESFSLELPSDDELAIAEAAFSKDHSLYAQMRDVRSNHKEISPIFVTNERIAASKNRQPLVETRAMRSYNYQQGASLFDQIEQVKTGNYETIGGGESQYKGFKISLIDVKEVDVVDLLRFICEQVGINLFVDYSVSQKNLKATYTFRNIPWDQALDIILKNANLEQQFNNGVLRVATVEKFQTEEKARLDLRRQQELSVPVETVYFPLSYAKVAEVVPIVTNYLSERGRIMQDERTNTMIIEDIPLRMVSIRSLIQRLDKQIPQVSIEARVVETSKRFLRELGIQWGLSAQYVPEMGTQTGVEFPNRVTLGGPGFGTATAGGVLGGYAVDFPASNVTGAGVGLSLGNFLDTFKLDISLQLAETTGQGRVISAPKVTTQNNKTALIQNGQRIPIQTISRGVITVQYINALLEMEVTPQITADETIIMDIVVDKSEPDFTRTLFGNPVINIRRAETRVMVKDGGTTVIGGIFTINTQGSENGVPWLKDVPILKRIFGSELDSLENTELLIFVTPKIVKY